MLDYVKGTDTNQLIAHMVPTASLKGTTFSKMRRELNFINKKNSDIHHKQIGIETHHLAAGRNAGKTCGRFPDEVL